MPKLRSRGRQRKPPPNLSPQDENLEDQDPASLDEIKDEKRKADSELDALCTQINYLLYETDFDKVSIRQAQDKLVKGKEKIFGIMTELRGVYRTRGEHRKADDVEVDMDLYQSRVGKVLQEVGDKLKEFAKRAVKPESDKDSFETEIYKSGYTDKVVESLKLKDFQSERLMKPLPRPPQTSFFKRVRHVFFTPNLQNEKWKLEFAAIWSVSLYQSLMEIKPSLNVSGLHFLTAWTKVANLQKLKCFDWNRV